MRRAAARGRMFPQSYSTDRRYGRLSVKALSLYPMMWSNADDQGRLCGDPEEIKYAVCPNIDHITKNDIPGILKELSDNKLIQCYDTPESAAIQFLDWWKPDANSKMQWAWPSEYPPPKGWKDHLRYKEDALTVVTENWPVKGKSSSKSSGETSGDTSGERNNNVQVNAKSASAESSGEGIEGTPLTTPSFKKTIKEKRKGRGRGNSPEHSGEKPSPAPSHLSVGENRVYELLQENYRMRWGRVRPERPTVVVPREIGARERAQLRDLAIELCVAGGGGLSCEDHVIKEAFDEAAKQQKFYVSYVRRILFDWLHIETEPAKRR